MKFLPCKQSFSFLHSFGWPEILFLNTQIKKLTASLRTGMSQGAVSTQRTAGRACQSLGQRRAAHGPPAGEGTSWHPQSWRLCSFVGPILLAFKLLGTWKHGLRWALKPWPTLTQNAEDSGVCVGDCGAWGGGALPWLALSLLLTGAVPHTEKRQGPLEDAAIGRRCGRGSSFTRSGQSAPSVGPWRTGPVAFDLGQGFRQSWIRTHPPGHFLSHSLVKTF